MMFTWAKIKFLLIDVGLFLFKYWYLVAALLLFVFVGVYVDSCRQANREKKIDRIESNITEQEVIANVLANQKNAVTNEVKQNEQNSNDARNGFDNSVKRDSNAFTGNAEDKFCRRFCDDSTCFEWRKRHPGYVCN